LTDWKNRIIGHGDEPLDEILFNPANWRIHPKAQQEALEGVLSQVGFVQDVIINKQTGHLVDGHLRCQVAARNGEKTIPAVYVDLTPEEESLILATIDPLSAMAATDKQKLDDLLHAVQSDDARVQEMMNGLAEREGLEFGKQEPADAEPQIDRAAELNEKWQVKTGDLYRIGEHKLLCGDSTKREDVERVMQGELCGACVTDSPYGINREGIENDDPEGLQDLLEGVLSVMPIENGVIINFQSPRLFPVWLDAIRKAGHKFERMIWMYKPNDVCYPWRGWLQKSEAILVSSVGEPSFILAEPYAHDTYTSNWSNETKGKVDGWHGSIKPLPLIQDLVSRVAGVLWEPFCGSGTTMVACQNLSRKCRAIEISPNYCAVILERMQTAFPDIEIEHLQ